MSFCQKAKEYDLDGKIRKQVEQDLNLLNRFREKYPFNTDPAKIDTLTVEELYQPGKDYFFKWVEHNLRGLGSIWIGSDAPWKSACNKLNEFKELLHKVVDDHLSLSEKVDAPWDKISGWGGDKTIAKKIISLFNDNVIPIFKTEHLEYFYERIVDEPLPPNYENMTLGEKYEFLNNALLEVKEMCEHTRDWTNVYFMRFLYDTFPPPLKEIYPGARPTSKPLSTIGLMFEPQNHDEVIFIFSKLHTKMGFPYIIKIQQAYPDILALDENRELKRIEIELYASEFNHDPRGCDYIVCWENDMREKPEDWPEVLQLKDYMKIE
jgi:hypothetical protein